MSSSSKKIKRLEGDVAALHKENDFLSRTRKAANAEIENLKKKLADVEGNLAEYQLPNSPLEKISHSKCGKEMDKLRDQLVRQQNHIFKMDETLREQQKFNKELQSKLKSAESGTVALAESLRKQKEMDNQMKAKDSKAARLERQLSQRDGRIQKLSGLEAEMKTLREEVKDLKKSADTHFKTVTAKDKEISFLQQEIGKLKKKLQSTKEQLEGKDSNNAMEQTEFRLTKLNEKSPPPEILRKKKGTKKLENQGNANHLAKVKTNLGKRKRVTKETKPKKRARVSARMKELQKWLKHRVEWKRRGRWFSGSVFKILSETTVRLLLDDGKIADVLIDKLDQTWRWEADAFYEINSIVSERFDRKRKVKLYKVSWKGFGKEDDSWVEEGNVTQAALDEYHDSKKK